MTLANRIESFDKLGQFFDQFKSKGHKKNNLKENELFFEAFEMLLKRAKENNGWFTEDQMYFAIEGWAKLLNKTNLEYWVKPYDLKDETTPLNIGVIMAGNIPLVGFHDFLSVLISGNKVQAKMSSNDPYLIPMISLFLKETNPEFKELIDVVNESLSGYDAVIATGSDNTARYFDYYFGKKPNIIRHNRNSIAVLTGEENQDQLRSLGEDIFRYYGLGCRNVSKIFVPKDYDFDQLFNAVYDFKYLTGNQKYMNNYDYNKAVFLMSLSKNMLENGFLVLKEDSSYSSPIATLFYEQYENLDDLKSKLKEDSNKIQCRVGLPEFCEIDFGEAQRPGLNDYADGVDVLTFLKSLQ